MTKDDDLALEDGKDEYLQTNDGGHEESGDYNPVGVGLSPDPYNTEPKNPNGTVQNVVLSTPSETTSKEM